MIQPPGLSTAGVVAAIVVASITVVGGITAVVRAIWNTLQEIYSRLTALELGMQQLNGTMSDLLQRSERRQHPRGV